MIKEAAIETEKQVERWEENQAHTIINQVRGERRLTPGLSNVQV